MGSVWTEQEEAYLRGASSSHSLRQMAEQLGRSDKAVRHRCIALGLHPLDGRSTEQVRAAVSAARTVVQVTGTHQKCTKCLNWKPFGEFGPDKTTHTGRSTRCRECRAAAAQARREADPEVRQRANEAAERHRRKRGCKPQVKYRIDELGRECTACRAYKPWTEFYRQGNPRNGKCKACWREHVRKTRYARDFGITIEDYEYLEAQQEHACISCGEPESAVHFRSGTQFYLSIDHDHACAQGHAPAKACRYCIRGLLCGTCNRLVGLAELKPKTAARFADYLARRPLLALAA